MIPKVERYYFYLYKDFRDGDNPLNFVQLIAHADKFINDDNLTQEQKSEIEENKRICSLFFEEAWNTRYGIVHYLINEFSDAEKSISYYKNLLHYSSTSFLKSISERIANIIKIIEDNKILVSTLEDNEKDDKEREKLEQKFYEQKFSYSALKLIANKILDNPDKFCRDENGNRIDNNFSGRLERKSLNGTVLNNFEVNNGEILGECEYFYDNGMKKEIVFRDGYVKRDLLKKWYQNGQISYEKISETNFRYWYENGQVKLERSGNDLKKWDEFGNRIE